MLISSSRNFIFVQPQYKYIKNNKKIFVITVKFNNLYYTLYNDEKTTEISNTCRNRIYK